jgi:hypothetical protein
VVSSVDLGTGVRTIALMKPPASMWGRPRLRAGDRISFAASLLTHARAYLVNWKGSFRLAE